MKQHFKCGRLVVFRYHVPKINLIFVTHFQIIIMHHPSQHKAFAAPAIKIERHKLPAPSGIRLPRYHTSDQRRQAHASAAFTNFEVFRGNRIMRDVYDVTGHNVDTQDSHQEVDLQECEEEYQQKTGSNSGYVPTFVKPELQHITSPNKMAMQNELLPANLLSKTSAMTGSFQSPITPYMLPNYTLPSATTHMPVSQYISNSQFQLLQQQRLQQQQRQLYHLFLQQQCLQMPGGSPPTQFSPVLVNVESTSPSGGGSNFSSVNRQAQPQAQTILSQVGVIYFVCSLASLLRVYIRICLLLLMYFSRTSATAIASVSISFGARRRRWSSRCSRPNHC